MVYLTTISAVKRELVGIERLPNASLMLDQRRRRWASNKLALCLLGIYTSTARLRSVLQSSQCTKYKQRQWWWVVVAPFVSMVFISFCSQSARM